METHNEIQTELKNFSDLIQPINIEDFAANYWEKQVLHIQRNNPDFFFSLFSIEDLDKVLEYNRPHGSSLKVVKSNQPMNSTVYENQDGSLNLNQLYTAYADGYSILINGIQRFWEPIKMLMESLRNDISHNASANLYLTPENEKAFSPHYDSHDVFALQISGEKHWILYDETHLKTPLLNSYQPTFQREQLTGAREITMRAGDILYMPRGVPHEAYTTDKSSMHITVGIQSVQWIDFITKSLLNLSQKHIELRKALPIGFLNSDNENLLSTDEELDFINILQQVFQKENIAGSLNILGEEFRTKEQPKPDGHFSSLDRLNHIHLESQLSKREGLTSKVTNSASGARISFQGNTIKGPSQIVNTLVFISQQEGIFSIKDIPFLNNENKLKLAKRLVRGGLLKVLN
ncbi:cupin domain-containing protein [Arcicella lustrica]|uniref:Cupin domain-containing protein n=1 Tax=Arcicella lustrica TaxID=2984196 RepID=A0ABU5SKK5_9BACT|nr:cupin domain-containing protein [Arcicella sp. DC25W]MEA5427834.1 cupin domain-containing protein [Arcicella sp. DC25W]